jgi:hypothetical protein
MAEKVPAGLHADRLKPNRENPREVAFAEKWKQENEPSRNLDLLALLFRVPCSRDDPACVNSLGLGAMGGYCKLPIGEPTERDRIVASTLVQWLGSNVGFGFIQEAIEKCGYKIVRK